MFAVASLQALLVLILSVLAFGLEVFALVDAIRTRADAFVAAGKQTKTLWLVILSIAAVLGFVYLPVNGNAFQALTILPIVAVVAAAVYLTDVRPAVRQIRGGGGGGRGRGNSGPYGPW